MYPLIMFMIDVSWFINMNGASSNEPSLPLIAFDVNHYQEWILDPIHPDSTWLNEPWIVSNSSFIFDF